MRAFGTAASAALLLLIPLAAFAQDTDEALWLAAYGQGTIGAKGRLHLEFQTRLNHDMSDLDRLIARYARRPPDHAAHRRARRVMPGFRCFSRHSGTNTGCGSR